MDVYDRVVQLTSSMTLVEKVRLLEHLSATLKQDLETEAYKRMPWQEFIDRTYGSLSDDSIERNQPLNPDFRDDIE